jgi:methionyl-tRNA formyltransferase
VRLLFAGTPQVAAVSLQALLESRHEVAAVLTRPDAAAGRGRKVAASPVADLARMHGIPVLQPASLRDEASRDELAAVGADCAPVVAYGALVPPEALAIPRLGWVNLHFSLLPAWRGAAPVQRAVWHGDDVTGACVFQLEEGLDTGPVFGSLTEPIGATDTSGDLLDRLAVAGSGLLVAVLDAMEDGSAVAVPQMGEPTVAPKISPADAQVDWALPTYAVDRHIRACTPAPGAWTTHRGERLGLGPVVPSAADGVLAPGALAVSKRDVTVGTAAGAVRLGWVRPAGKKQMPAADWARGLRLGDGEQFA